MPFALQGKVRWPRLKFVTRCPGRRAGWFRLSTEVLGSTGWRYGTFALLSLSFGFLTLLPVGLYQYFTQSVLSLDETTAPLFIQSLLILGALVAVTLFVSGMVSALGEEWISANLESSLRRTVLLHLHSVPLEKLDGIQRGKWLQGMTDSLARVEAYLGTGFPRQLRQGGILVGISVLFFHFSGWFGLIPLASAAVVVVLGIFLQRGTSDLFSGLRNLRGDMAQMLLESVEGARSIRSQGAGPFIQRKFEGKLSEVRSRRLRVARSLGGLWGGNQLAGHVFILICLVAITFALRKGELTLMEALVYPFFVGLFYEAVHKLLLSRIEWNQFRSEANRLSEILYAEDDGKTAAACCPTKDFTEASILDFKNFEVGFKRKALAGPFDLRLTRGEVVALSGQTGCGKTVLLQTLAGLRPSLAGEIRVSGVTGLLSDSRSGGEKGLPPGICAFVEQTPYLFEGTLRENLVFNNPARNSDTMLWATLERVGLYDFAQVAGGLEFRLKDSGCNLSVGERYRVGLCRALLLGRPFLFLDEPFGALDSATLNGVVATLNVRKRDMGILMATSHPIPKNLQVDQQIEFGVFVTCQNGFEFAPLAPMSGESAQLI